MLSDEVLAIGQWTQIRSFHVWRWTYDIDTGLKSGYTLAFHGNTYIFVGDNGDEGEIAVSKDGGETFELLPALPVLGPVHMALDEDFSRNKLLYAATEDSSSAIYRWVVGGAVDWNSLQPPDLGFSGLAQTEDVSVWSVRSRRRQDAGAPRRQRQEHRLGSPDGGIDRGYGFPSWHTACDAQR